MTVTYRGFDIKQIKYGPEYDVGYRWQIISEFDGSAKTFRLHHAKEVIDLRLSFLAKLRNGVNGHD